MQVVYAQQEFPGKISSSIFLAGPTPRDIAGSPPSWRPKALEILEELGYTGTVLVPEPESGQWNGDYLGQVEWEEKALNAADVILFWIPREMEFMPGLTTNDEFGVWRTKHPNKLVLGTPESAVKVKYQQYYATKLGIPLRATLRGAVKAALEKISSSNRVTPEIYIPEQVVNSRPYSSWISHMNFSGNYLKDARVEWRSNGGFLTVLKAEVHVAAENRVKDNEVVVMRPDISAAVLYHYGEDSVDPWIVLVKEFRSAVCNIHGYVYELPSGSSPKKSGSAETVTEEIEEETGLHIAECRLKYHGAKQPVATLLTHRIHTFSAHLTDTELEFIQKSRDQKKGNFQDGEVVWADCYRYSDILSGRIPVDAANIGLIAAVLRNCVVPV